MTEPQPVPADDEPSGEAPGPYNIILSDAAMDTIKQMPPEAVDDLAHTLARLRENPHAVTTRPLIPHPVDHAPGRPNTPVPAVRSVSYLRNAVAEISPPTVAAFDQELREDTSPPDPTARLAGLRRFLCRWIEYIALEGDHEAARHLEAATTADEAAERFTELMRRVRRDHFPDAQGQDLSVKVSVGGREAVATCPVTMIRVRVPVLGDLDADAVERQARSALDTELMRMLTGL